MANRVNGAGYIHLVVACLGIVSSSCSPTPGSGETTSAAPQAITNGVEMTTDQWSRSRAVSIVAGTFGVGKVALGSGTIIAPDVVLTAGHVVEVRERATNIRLRHVEERPQGRHVIEHPFFFGDTTEEHDVPVFNSNDMALIFTSASFANLARLPQPQCLEAADIAISRVRCESGQIRDSGELQGNFADFNVRPGTTAFGRAIQFTYDKDAVNNRVMAEADSGMGCYACAADCNNQATNTFAGVHVIGVSDGNDGFAAGRSESVNTECKFMNFALTDWSVAHGSLLSMLALKRSSNQPSEVAALVRESDGIAAGVYFLDSALVLQRYATASVPTDATIRSSAIGEFQEPGRFSLVYVDAADNTLKTAGVTRNNVVGQGVPIDGADLGELYKRVFSFEILRRADVGTFADIVATNKDDDVHVFWGTRGRLVRDQSAYAEISNLDGNVEPDFLITSAGDVHMSSGPIIPFTAAQPNLFRKARKAVAARFRELPNRREDVVVLGDDELAFCRTNGFGGIELCSILAAKGTLGPIKDIHVEFVDNDEFADLVVEHGTDPLIPIETVFTGSAGGLAAGTGRLRTEFVAILLDETGSMTLPGTVDSIDRWDDAINAAAALVGVDALTPFVPRAYAIRTFKRGGGQDGIQQVWPTGDSDCSDFDATTGFCRLATADDYNALVQTLEDLRESRRAVVGPNTPLAESLCEAVESLRTLPGRKRLMLESDGDENASLDTHPCFGAPSGDFDIWDLSQLDWGMTVGSWQAKVIRRAARVRLSITEAVRGVLTARDAFAADFTWQVGIHFALIDPNGLVAQTNTRADVEDSNTSSPSRSIATAVAAPDINAAELAFFRNLGQATPRSSFATHVRVPGTVYGVPHTLAGDVDDSGCVDRADFQIIRQSDIWLKRAVLPLELAVRADVNRDGWVNFGDVNVVLDHWGAGCINPPGQPPTCSDGLLSRTETDVDCGGPCSSCAEGKRCRAASDCQSRVCQAGICAPPEPPAFDACQCRPNKCNDCTNAIAQCTATPGCLAVVACTFASACSFPHESCQGGRSCYDIVGESQNSPAGRAANNAIACMGGC
jgi:hypothetical protein